MENYDEGCTIKNIYLGFKFAFSYFSILPVKFNETDDLSNKYILKYMLFFFPLIGLVISTLTLLIYISLEPSWFTALLCAVLYMLLYGFLHTEAIADVSDALYASHSGKDAYKVIKEPTIGAMGLLYTTAFMILKIASLTFLFLNHLYLEFIVIAIFSRLSIVYIIYLNNFRSSFVSTLKNSLTKSILSISTLIYLSILFSLINVSFLYLGLVNIITSYLFIKYLQKRLGFLNGDVLGANLELVELVMIILLILSST